MQRRAEWLIFILVNLNLNLSPLQSRRLYRRCFGIETSYRCAALVEYVAGRRSPILLIASSSSA
jgi:hypothetical protein